jgi:hypothetical protein
LPPSSIEVTAAVWVPLLRAEPRIVDKIPVRPWSVMSSDVNVLYTEGANAGSDPLNALPQDRLTWARSVLLFHEGRVPLRELQATSSKVSDGSDAASARGPVKLLRLTLSFSSAVAALSSGSVPVKLLAERSSNWSELSTAPAGNVPERLLAAKSSVVGRAELLNAGSVPLNWLLLAATSVSLLALVQLGSGPVNRLPRSTRSVRSSVDGMLARLPVNALPARSTVVRMEADAQLGWGPVQRLSLSRRVLRAAGTVKLQLGPMRLLLRSSATKPELLNVRPVKLPDKELPCSDKDVRDVEDHVSGSWPTILDEDASSVVRVGICHQLLGMLPLMRLPSMEIDQRLLMGLLPDPHCGSGPTMPQEEPRNVAKLVMGDQGGSALLMGLLLRSR